MNKTRPRGLVLLDLSVRMARGREVEAALDIGAHRRHAQAAHARVNRESPSLHGVPNRLSGYASQTRGCGPANEWIGIVSEYEIAHLTRPFSACGSGGTARTVTLLFRCWFVGTLSRSRYNNRFARCRCDGCLTQPLLLHIVRPPTYERLQRRARLAHDECALVVPISKRRHGRFQAAVPHRTLSAKNLCASGCDDSKKNYTVNCPCCHCLPSARHWRSARGVFIAPSFSARTRSVLKRNRVTNSTSGVAHQEEGCGTNQEEG